MELKTARNCHARYHLNYHLIMVTKYRKRCITQDLFLSLKDQLEKIAKMNGAEILEIAYEPDHVHILLEAPPQACLSEMINAIWKPYFWSRSYLILSSGGAPIEVIRTYIQEQGTEEKKKGG